SPTSITSGQSSTLTWSSTNATSCTASGGWTGTKTISGTQAVTPTVTTAYTLACTGSGGTATQSTTVTVSSVTPPPPPSSSSAFWTEDWAGYTVGDNCFHNANWNRANDGQFNPDIVTSANGLVFSGTQACHGHYTVPSGTGASGTYADRFFGTTVSEVWGRVMHRVTGPNGVGTFTYAPDSNKRYQIMNSNLPANTLSNFWVEGFADTNGIGYVAQTPTLGTINYKPNVANIAVTDPTHWYCLEQHIKAGTPGNADGLVEAWVD